MEDMAGVEQVLLVTGVVLLAHILPHIMMAQKVLEVMLRLVDTPVDLEEGRVLHIITNRVLHMVGITLVSHRIGG